MTRAFFMLGAVFAGFAVMAGAFGAHALKDKLEPNVLQVFETAVRYQMYHALGLLAVAWACTKSDGRGTRAAGWLFIAGMVLFSGSLYAYCLSGIKAFGMITPIGGVCFMIGWVLLALSPRGWSKE
jgi:uncharacterized membrane protein YgdD (TMEM256/DUF423 family)